MIPGMMGSEKKGIASLIMGKDESGPEEIGVEKDSEMGLSAAADDILSAIEMKDSKGLKSALKSFLEMCEPEGEHEEKEEIQAE